MIYIQSTVKAGAVKLPDAIKVSDGSRVIVTILEPATKGADSRLPEDLESEDVDFVRACQGCLAKQFLISPATVQKAPSLVNFSLLNFRCFRAF